MKIKSNMKKDYIKHYNIATGIAINKRRIYKKKTNRVLSYLSSILISILLLLVFTILFSIIDNSKIFAIIFIVLLSIYIIHTVVHTIWSYNYKRKNNFLNVITLDENGLHDQSFYNVKINLDWSKLTAIVIKKNTITILTDTWLYFFFNISEKKEILTTVKKYKKDILIIE